MMLKNYTDKDQISNLKSLTVKISFFIISLFCLGSNSFAQGDLLVMPKRVVFEGNKRFEDLNLANIGKDTATYVISFVQVRMREDGSFENITEPDSSQLFADKFLRIFPRTVTLGPNEAQTVKVQVTKKNEMAAGEYRSHLYFRAVPKENPLGEIDKNPPKDSSISVVLVPIYGISIPVIIRNGETRASMKFSDLSFQYEKDTIPTLKMSFNREGNVSTYGDISVDHIAKDGTVTRVGTVKGLAVYTPNTLRKFNMALNKLKTVNYKSGKLHVVYSDQTPRANMIAESFIDLRPIL